MIQAETITELTPYLEFWSSGIYMFKCPGCKYLHPFYVKASVRHNGSTWDFNGNVDKPTFTPSLLINDHYPTKRCHLFLTEGKIQFLSDCHHELAGKTVAMVPIDV
ncbi:MULTISPECIES: DUF6527 family protein [unclassified Acinetobacter]|uniref:DUF6527 family protein n=1 Tax=unclassified Acinetobacter TaxID=196816 RepID=UPI00287EAFB1|nr:MULTISPECIES: DUF6527 family protein [unclassified Acinetobacter]MDS7956788.1 DUF6527 family protein [Acinetobacter sp. V104_13]MDS7984323.1 DUF6527 family protein [Acinetobacter sp. V104_3]